MSTAHRRRKKRIAGGILWISFFLVAMMIMAIFLIFLYFDQPFHIENTDILVDTAITQIVGDSYEDNRFLTRQEVLLIISDVFLGLEQKGFKKTESVADVIDQSRKLKILEGNSTGFALESPATKQEALVFIARSLGILKEIAVENSPTFSPNTLFDRWAKPQIEGLVIRDYFSVSEIDMLYNLREYITVHELERILNQIVEVKTQPMSFMEFTVSWLNNDVVLAFSLLSGVASIIAIVGFAIQMLDRKQQSTQNRQQKASREFTVCLAGSASVGKSTLTEKAKTPGKLLYVLEREMVPTRTSHEEKLILRSSNGEIIAPGTMIDTPGTSPADVLLAINGPHKNKILLLILAHTKTYEGDKIDQSFIQEQLDDIQKLWTTVIRGCSNQLEKIVIFVNKIDLLSQEYLPAQKHIYEKHIKLLYEAAKEAGVPIEAAEGSSTTGTNLDALYRLLHLSST